MRPVSGLPPLARRHINKSAACRFILIASAGLSACAANDVLGHISTPDKGQLLATGGVSQVEGAGGSGLANWATITGYGSRDSYGATAFHTRAHLDDFDIQVTGVAIGAGNRVELSNA